MSISQIVCKDCGKSFFYGDHAAGSDRMAGRSAPERCGTCRNFHRREYSVLGTSHSEVLQLRTNGHGGLSRYIRDRRPPREMTTHTTDREPLPIDRIIDDLINKLLTSPKRIHLVVGPTGSGKSTWLPFKLVSCADLIRKGAICVTQPRIPATEGPSAYIGELYYGKGVKPSVGPGLIVGYRHSQVGTSRTDSANRMIFMTDGTLLNEIKSGDIQKYSVVMIDEAHERSVNIDTILSLLKHNLPRFPELRVIIASATVDAQTFINFFGGTEQVEQYVSEGFTYPILEVFSDETVAYWPGGLIPTDSFPDASTWKKLDDKLMEREWLGPSPCFDCAMFSDYRLRYYPHFESLILRGVMSDEEQKSLLKASPDAAWRDAVHSLYRQSRRTYQISETDGIAITDSIRGPIPKQKHPDLYKSVDQNIKSRLVHAAADTICRLVERDETEAGRRRNRWQQRASYQWDKLEEPRPVGHILAFFPTTATIGQCAEILEKRLPDLPGKNQVFLYHRELSEAEKEHVTEKAAAQSGLRKIILGTNLAETSLTLDGLVYVVDTGLILQTFYNPDIRGLDYPTILHSYAGCRQRLGRVGRKEPGEGYRLYTRKELKDHPAYTTPEVTRSDPAQLILNLVSSGLPPSFVHQPGALMQPPDRKWIHTALSDMQKLEAIDRDGDLTRRGTELMAIPEKNLSVAVLMCEADRFGCLWEMAVFLCFMGLPDKSGPDGLGKWLAVWAPDNRGVFEDQLEEKLFDEGDPAEHESPAAANTVWSDPYVKANALIKQQALRCGCLDDLELYLRIWQGWIGQGPDPEKRSAWAFEHGVSAEALLRVERALGLDPKDTSETGMLRHFWAFDQKGIMKRDIHFEVLDKVRYLYAAASSNGLFSRSPEGVFCSHSETRPAPGMETTIQVESVWNSPDIHCPMRFGKPAELKTFIATAKIKPRKKKILQALRHIVWLDPIWIQNGLPNLFDNPVHLARKFSDFTDQYLIQHGRWPFARGSRLCGLTWPMPGVPVPTATDVQQWRIRYAGGINARTQYTAVLHHAVTWPQGIKQIGFVQLLSGPLLPMTLGQNRPYLGERLDVFLKDDEKTEFLWAVQPKPKAESSDTLPEEENEIIRKSVDDKEAPTPVPELKPVAEKSAPAPVSPKVIPIRRPESVDFQKLFPANSVVEAEFVKCATSLDRLWVTVSIPIPDNRNKNWDFPVFREFEKKQFSEAPAGKRCRVAFTQWLNDTKSGKPKPRLAFKGWIR